MRKIVLGTTPKNFKSPVTITLPDGEKSEIEVSYIYRTRLQVADMLDELNASIEKINEPGAKKSESDRLRETVNSEADQVMAIIDGWDIGDFNRETVIQFCNEYENASSEIIGHYAVALSEFKRGN